MLGTVLLSGCGQTSMFNPVDYDLLVGRTVLLLEPTYTPPLPKTLHAEALQRIEQQLSQSPHIRKLITPREFQEFARDRVALREDHRQLSETLSLIGIADPELAHRLGKATGADLIILAQVVYTPCPACDQGDQLWVVGHVVETKNGEVLLRVHQFVHTEGAVQDLTQESRLLVFQFLGLIEESFRPKWFKLRFKNLRTTQPS